MKVTMTDGKLIRICDFALLPDCVLGDLIENLRAHGVKMDNQLRITDIS